MLWFGLTLFSTSVSAITSILQKRHLVLDSHHPITSGALYQIVAGFSVALFGIITNQLRFESSVTGIIITVGISMLWVVGGSLYVWLMKHTEASIVSLIMTSRVVFTTIVAYIFLREYSTSVQIIGMVCILAGVVLTHHFHRKVVPVRTVLLLVLTALIFGLGNIADRVAVKEMNLYLYISASFLLPGILTLIIMILIEGKRALTHSFLQAKPILIVGVLTAIAATAQVTATSIAPTISQVVFISQLKTIVVIVLAAIFLRERSHLLIKIFASILCTIGLVLLS